MIFSILIDLYLFPGTFSVHCAVEELKPNNNCLVTHKMTEAGLEDITYVKSVVIYGKNWIFSQKTKELLFMSKAPWNREVFISMELGILSCMYK